MLFRIPNIKLIKPSNENLIEVYIELKIQA